MSKELEALKELRSFCGDVYYSEIYDKDYKLIETALKRLEQLEEEKQSFDRATEKKLEAFEIIKEKGCLQFCMLGVSLEDYNHSVDIANKDYGFERYKHYNQEEFDLLKEVLI